MVILPKRKNLRLRGFDYSSQETYFVTICTKGKQGLFWENNDLNELGKIVRKHVEKLSSHYFGVKIDNYAIMPNHIHLLVTIGLDALPKDEDVLLNNIYNKYTFPNLKVIIGGLKSGITKEIHGIYPQIRVWQRGYYDHIINNLNDYNETWDYIENNPNVWIAKNNRSNSMKIKTAGLIVELNINHDILLSRIEPYRYDGDEDADIVFNVTEKYYVDRQAEHPNLTIDEAEYLWSGAHFYEKLAKFNGVMLHASCVEYEGKAYLFSARSGTGKSTHTHLWLKYLPGARIINDDKPAIRLVDGVFYAYGTPWSGKTDESVNDGVPIAGITFLSRGENKIERIPGIKALKLFMDQTVRPYDKELMKDMLETLNKILTEVPIYEMSCDMSEEAVMTSLNGMRN